MTRVKSLATAILYRSQWCYEDYKNSIRILPYRAADNLNPNGAGQCSALCKAAGYELAGTQYSAECWCGNSLNVMTVLMISTVFSTVPSNSALSGNAFVSNGECVLTSNAQSQSGYLLFNSFALTPTSFNAQWDYRVSDGSGADGTSFNYGPMTTAAGGEWGMDGAVLTVSFIEFNDDRVELKYNGNVISSAAFTLTGNAYRRVNVNIDSVNSVFVSVGGSNVISTSLANTDYSLRNKTGWRFGFASRSGGSTNKHSIKNLVIWGGNSLNGAQPIPNSDCNMPCLGNAAEMCGGVSRNSVYTTGLTASTLTLQDFGFTGPHTNKFLVSYTSGTYLYTSETLAKNACTVRDDCKGVTQEAIFTLRTGLNLTDSGSGEVSWQLIKSYTGPHTNKSLATLVGHTVEYTSETLAKNACNATADCSGFTLKLSNTRYTLRTGLTLTFSGSGEVSWQKSGTSFTGPHTNKFLASYTSGTYLYTSETLAKNACQARTDCKGVTQEAIFTLRTGLNLTDSGSGEVSWQLIKSYTGPHTNKSLASLVGHTVEYTSDTLAKDACNARADCSGFTGKLSNTRYTLRTGLNLTDSLTGMISWQKTHYGIQTGLCDQLLQQFHRVDEELSIQGKWQGGSVTGVCRGWGTNKVRSIVHYSLSRYGRS
jgi:hypothetical protein